MHHSKEERLGELLVEALRAIEAGRYAFASNNHVESDIAELGLSNRDEYLDVIHGCIQLAIEDPVACYRPPQEPVSTAHELTYGMQMHAFVVRHEDFKTNIYFKFCLNSLPDGKYYLHIDCHESRNCDA